LSRFDPRALVLLFAVMLPANLYAAYKLVRLALDRKGGADVVSRTYESQVREYESLNREFSGRRPVVFAGDSLVFRFAVEEYFPQLTVVNRGVYNDSATGLRKRWESTVSGLLPGFVVIMIGTNDILVGHGPDVAGQLDGILDSLAPGSACVLSIPPLGKEFCGKNDQVRAVNQVLQRVVKAKGQLWVDVFDDLNGDDGCLSVEFTDDGIHLNGKGYQVVSSRLREVFAPWVK